MFCFAGIAGTSFIAVFSDQKKYISFAFILRKKLIILKNIFK